MIVSILSLFPSYFDSPLSCSLVGRAIQDGRLSVDLVDVRKFALRQGDRVDDRPFGGGPGMILETQSIMNAVASVASPRTRIIMLSPAGRPLNARLVKELAQEEHLLFICGHYEGIDARVLDICVDESISIGDFVLTNGCLAALVVLDAVSRFLVGVIGNESSILEDSFENTILDFPHYTRPRSYLGYKVPEVLLSGHHDQIASYRKAAALESTGRIRPDLFLFTLPAWVKEKVLLMRYTEISFSILIDWYRVFGFSVSETEHGLLASVGQISVHFISVNLACFNKEMPSQLVHYVSEEERTKCERSLTDLFWPCIVSKLSHEKETLTCLRVTDPSGLEWLVVSGCYGGEVW